jgi:hypothetical protein
MSTHVAKRYTVLDGGRIYDIENSNGLMVMRSRGLKLDKALVAKQLGVESVAAIWTEEGFIYDFVLNEWRDFYREDQVMKSVDPTPSNANMNIASVLAERGSRYGSFSEHARITQSIKDAMANSKNFYLLDPSKKEALEMVAHKIGRILNGDPNYLDSWVDIVGYTQLIVDQLNGKDT